MGTSPRFPVGHVGSDFRAEVDILVPLELNKSQVEHMVTPSVHNNLWNSGPHLKALGLQRSGPNLVNSKSSSPHSGISPKYCSGTSSKRALLGNSSNPFMLLGLHLFNIYFKNKRTNYIFLGSFIFSSEQSSCGPKPSFNLINDQ